MARRERPALGAIRRASLGILLILLASAILLIADWSGRKGATGVTSRAARGAAGRPWRVSFIQLNEVLDVEESDRGVRTGVREAGVIEGRDLIITVRNAHGDMPTVTNMVDAAVTEGADLLVTFSSPTLQAAIQRAGRTPVVFTYVANAKAAGAGRSDTDHLPNVTGCYSPGAYQEVLDLMLAYFPHLKRIGSVYVPSEVNTVFHRDQMLAVATAHGVEFKAMAANSSTEVADAAMALATSNVDAICQLTGNLTASAFPAILHAAREARIPVFGFQGALVHQGALAGVARDYYDSGREAAGLAVRILRGESPATIPLVEFKKTMLMINLDTARELGITTPPAILAGAREIVGR